jgi:hypothetical protein
MMASIQRHPGCPSKRYRIYAGALKRSNDCEKRSNDCEKWSNDCEKWSNDCEKGTATQRTSRTVTDPSGGTTEAADPRNDAPGIS